MSCRTWFVVLGVVGSVLFTPPPSYAQKIYWTDPATDKIQRADLDGSNVEDLVTGLLSPVPIALDHVNNKMYWAEPIGAPGAQFSRANFDGSNIEVLFTTGEYVNGFANDLAAGKIYYTRCFDNANGIYRNNLDGSNEERLVNLITADPWDIALDIPHGKMYWITDGPSRVQRANLDGTNVEDLVTSVNLDGPRGIALDSFARKMYWSDPFSGKIQRANLNGSQLEDLVISTRCPVKITVDSLAGKMYWTAIREPGLGIIYVANLDGTDLQELVTGDLQFPVGIALDVPLPMVPAVSAFGMVCLAVVIMVIGCMILHRRDRTAIQAQYIVTNC